jgi:Domain of unknown function (DUF4439)
VSRAAAGRKARAARRRALAALSPQAVAALQAALAAEQAASYGYGVVGAHLNASAAQSRAADADWVAHQQARDSLTAMITSAGADPAPAPVAYQLPVHVQTPAEARSLAVILEDKVAQAYLGLVALPDHSLRALGARELTAAALRAAAWRRATVAFPGLPGPDGTSAAGS